MFSQEIVFDVRVNIDIDKQRFTSILYCVTQNKDVGEIQGSIEKENDLKIYTVDTSEVNDEWIGYGIGYNFYTETIKKCFKAGCQEFRSSTCRNENSERLWSKIYAKFYNTVKHKRYYSVTLPIKNIL